jgi:hypothetical protein
MAAEERFLESCVLGESAGLMGITDGNRTLKPEPWLLFMCLLNESLDCFNALLASLPFESELEEPSFDLIAT